MKSEMYFTTSTVKDWMRLFSEERFRNIILKSLEFLIRENRIDLHGYVLMPNHLHSIFTVRASYNLGNIFRDFHKFTSQQIIKLLRNQNSGTLNKFVSQRSDRKYQIWQATHAPKEIETFDFFKQKLNYIHWNPCSGRWHLCEQPEEYLYSSARDYLTDEEGLLKIVKVLC
jgi:putative transposase